MTDYKRIIANNISELRKAVPLTQAELAEKLNYSDKAVSKWERGESIPDVVVLKDIADIFGVTVDYLLEEVHPLKATMQSVPRQLKKNRFLISALSCMLVFLVATIAFVVLNTLEVVVFKTWLVYVYSVPICSILLIVFNSIWGKRKLNFLFISLLVWSLLASIYLTVGYQYWLLFIVGIPGQLIILLWSGIKARIFKK